MVLTSPNEKDIENEKRPIIFARNCRGNIPRNVPPWRWGGVNFLGQFSETTERNFAWCSLRKCFGNFKEFIGLSDAATGCWKI